MCSNETMERMSRIEAKLLDMLEDGSAKGLEAVNAEEMGEVVDMVKDLAEAKYYCSVVHAMQETDPMGYNRNRDQHGRFTMGYDPMDGMSRYKGVRGPDSYAYDEIADPMRNGPSHGVRNGYGGAMGRYHEARMGYQHQSTADNRRMMEQTADEHMKEVEDSIREIWEDADQRPRNKMKAALVSMANGLK